MKTVQLIRGPQDGAEVQIPDDCKAVKFPLKLSKWEYGCEVYKPGFSNAGEGLRFYYKGSGTGDSE